MGPTVDFFFYGTLRDADVRDAVMGPGAATTVSDAELPGFRCVPAEGGRFPGVVRAPGAAATGVLAAGVSLDVAARLSFFEGEGYDYGVELCRVVDRERARKAWVFLPSGRLRLGAGRWDIEVWRRRFKASFVANARAAMNGYTPRRQSRYLKAWEERLDG
jgi:hypothetical protein